jgi:hypothetical protein
MTSRFLALMLFAVYLHALSFDPEDVGSTFLCNVGEVLAECTVLHPRTASGRPPITGSLSKKKSDYSENDS